MSRAAVEHFASELERLIDHTSREYQVVYQELIGVLQMKVIELTMQAMARVEEPDRGD